METEEVIFLATDLTVERTVTMGAGEVALRNVNLSLNRGELLVVAGESGSGKSLLCRLAAGAIDPRLRRLSGTIRIAGVDLFEARARVRRDLRASKICYLGKRADRALNPNRTVEQTLRDFSFLVDRKSRSKQPDWNDCFYRVGIVEPERILSRKIGDLAAINIQRLCLMRALIAEAQLVICDESSSSLDRVAEGQFLDILNRLREEEGYGVLVASGSLRGVANYADRAAVLYEGGILEEGNANEIVARPSHPYIRELLSLPPNLERAARELPSISAEAIRAAEETIHGVAEDESDLVEEGTG
ncbi:MAG: ATP-binding cassette domain-containing protein [Verrucomicrobiota bacterium]